MEPFNTFQPLSTPFNTFQIVYNMNLYIKYDIPVTCKTILQDILNKSDLDYKLISFWEIDLQETVSQKSLSELKAEFSKYGIGIVESHKSILVQKIKDAIIEMVYMEEKLPTSKTSAYLADKLKHRYGYISNLFSEVTFTSIENFIILQKIERAKQLLITNELTITEIAWKLNYSSVAHLSNQFKNVTGLTPSMFLRIINRRRTARTEEESVPDQFNL
jgi:AraC-like DNA-binding protein